MARQDAMAAIDRALNPPPKEEQPEQNTGPESPLPIVEPIKSTPKKKKQGVSQKGEQAKQQEAIDTAFSRTDDSVARQDTDLSGVQKTYDAFWKILKKLGDAASTNIERLPTPGALAVPLILLLLFFFLLIPINGHTRIVWLWLTLTGNAEISPAQGAQGASGNFSLPTTPNPQQNNGVVTLSLPVMGSSFMTGASEDFL